MALTRFDFREPPLLTDEEICEVLSRAEALAAWVSGVKEYALQSAMKGKRLPGWKVVDGRAVRKFRDDAAACARLSAAGVDPYEKRMLGVTALERRLGRRVFRDLLADLVIRQAGKPVLVPETDRRPEMTALDFASAEEASDENEG